MEWSNRFQEVGHIRLFVCLAPACMSFILSTFIQLFTRYFSIHPSVQPSIFQFTFFFRCIFLSTNFLSIHFSIYFAMHCFLFNLSIYVLFLHACVCVCAEVVRSKLLFFSVLWHPFVTYRIYSVYQPASASLIFFQGPYMLCLPRGDLLELLIIHLACPAHLVHLCILSFSVRSTKSKIQFIFI
jgi:hypothetical protein